MKPHVVHAVPATREAFEKAFGAKIGELFIRNPAISEYAMVLRFPGPKTIVSGELERTLKKFMPADGATLLIGQDFTKEAREAAIEMHCDIISEREFGWTDDLYQKVRQE